MRRYAEAVEVRTGSASGDTMEQPEIFVWRGRLYVVRGVVNQWHHRHPWWRYLTEEEGSALDAGADQVVWRVQASAGRHLGVGVFDLLAPASDAGSGVTGWRLTGVQD